MFVGPGCAKSSHSRTCRSFGQPAGRGTRNHDAINPSRLMPDVLDPHEPIRLVSKWRATLGKTSGRSRLGRDIARCCLGNIPGSGSKRPGVALAEFWHAEVVVPSQPAADVLGFTSHREVDGRARRVNLPGLG